MTARHAAAADLIGRTGSRPLQIRDAIKLLAALARCRSLHSPYSRAPYASVLLRC